MSKIITAERLRQVLHYDPETGAWTWLVTNSNAAPTGSIAGCVFNDGYRYIRIDWRLYKASRLAVLYMTGKWPKDKVDHHDLNRSNDRWKNLREATSGQNNMNVSKRKDNTSGLKGVTWAKREKKWAANIQLNKKQHHLGYFDCPAAAHLAYVLASADLHGEFGRVN